MEQRSLAAHTLGVVCALILVTDLSGSRTAAADTIAPFADPPAVEVWPMASVVMGDQVEGAAATVRFEVPLEVVAHDDGAEYEVALAVDSGWLAQVVDPYTGDARGSVVVSAGNAEGPHALLLLTRDGDVAVGSSDLVRVKLDFRDVGGVARDGGVVLHFARAGTVLVPVTFDDFIFDQENSGVDDGTSAYVLEATGQVAPEAAASTSLSSVAVAAEGESAAFIYGQVVFWDTRPRYAPTGSRYPTCDSTVYACDVGMPGCCKSPVPSLRLVFEGRDSPTDAWIYLGETGTDDAGRFFLATLNYGATKRIRMTVRFDQVYPGGPGDYELSTGTSGTFVVQVVQDVPVSQAIDLGTVQLNPSGDLTSLVGDVAAAWASVIDADRRLAEEGETTQRAGTTAFRILDTAQALNCEKGAAIDAFITPGEARTPAPARALGRVLLARLVGCSAINYWPLFPVSDLGAQTEFNSHLHDRDTAEGVALVAAIPELVALLTWWDPATATWSGMKGTQAYKCIANSPTAGYCNARWQWVVTGTTGLSNSNNLASYRNNAFALWNLIDTSSADAFYCKTDTVDLTVRDLMVALLAFQAGPQDGTNGAANEMSLVSTSIACITSEDCSVGAACGGLGYTRCFTGDPHGTNLRDWLRYLSSGEASAVAAMTSHECVGAEDNVEPFRGGYRGD